LLVMRTSQSRPAQLLRGVRHQTEPRLDARDLTLVATIAFLQARNLTLVATNANFEGAHVGIVRTIVAGLAVHLRLHDSVDQTESDR
jgi:hypothetical protein